MVRDARKHLSSFALAAFPHARKKGPRNIRFGDLPYVETRSLKLHDALSHHGVGDLLEASDVSTGDQVVAQAIACLLYTSDAADD